MCINNQTVITIRSYFMDLTNLKVGKACPDFCFCCFWTCRAILLVRLVLAFNAGVFLATSAHVLFLTDFLIERAGVLAGFFGVAFLAAKITIFCKHVEKK